MAKLTDMTTGSISKHLLAFAAPLLLGNIVQQFYNMVDSIIVGNYVGQNALAAVGTCGSMGFLFFSLFWSCYWYWNHRIPVFWCKRLSECPYNNRKFSLCAFYFSLYCNTYWCFSFSSTLKTFAMSKYHL